VLIWVHRLGGVAGQTGVGRYARELIAGLASAHRGELDVRVGSCRGDEVDRPSWLPADVPLHRLAVPRAAVHAGWLLSPWPRVEWGSGPADLVHATYPSFPVRSAAPVVYTFHDLLPITNPEWYGSLERRGFAACLAAAKARSPLTLTNSEHTRGQLCERAGFDPARVRAVPMGIAGRFVEPADASAVAAAREGVGVRGRYVVQLGAVAARKNPVLSVEALAQPGCPEDLELVFAGPDGGACEQVRGAAERLGVAGRVHLAGYVDDRPLVALLQGAQALVHPSSDEGFGFTPLEAMAAGVPAMVAGTGALPETVGDAALVIDSATPDAWAAALARIDDVPTMTKLREAGRERAATFTWDRHVDQVVDAYRTVVGRV
jgi:glycosyltransferase involved in cell wall biosynthesis